MAITLAKGALSVTFARGRVFPTTTESHINQLLELGESGVPQVTELAGTVTQFTVELLSVDSTTEAAFRTFFEDATVRWAVQTVTLTDELGTAYVGRYWGPLPYVRTHYASGLLHIVFTFRVET